MKAGQLVFKNGDIPIAPLRGGLTAARMGTLLRTPIRRLVAPGTPPDFTREEAEARYFRGGSDSFDLSCHNHRELFWILGGEICFQIESGFYCGRPGDVFLIDRWQEHGNPASEPQGGVLYTGAVIHFHPEAWGCISQAGAPCGDTIAEDSWLFLDRALARLFNGRCDMARSPALRPRFGDWVRPAVESVLSEYALLYLGRLRENASTDDPVGRVRAHIRDKLGVGCSLGRLAEVAGCGATHLERLYKERTGETIREAIGNVRREFVLSARVNNHHQKEIAAALGFSAVSNFAKWMGKAMPPRG